MTSSPNESPSHPVDGHFLDQHGRTVGMLIGSVLFPSHALLNLAFQPYLNLNEFLHQGMSATTLLNLLSQMNALSSQVLLGRILPILLLGVVLSTAFLFLGGYLGHRLTRFLRLRLL